MNPVKFLFCLGLLAFVLLFFLFTRSGFYWKNYLLIPFSFVLFACRFLGFYRFLLWFIIIAFDWLFYPFSPDDGLCIFYGIPGSGKTSTAAYLARHSRLDCVYSNVPLVGSLRIDRNDIGKYDISNGDLIVDEAGSEFSGRFGTKKGSSLYTSEDQAKWIREFRHHKIKRFCLFSQRVDIDPILRNICYKVYILQKTKLPFLVILLGCKQRLRPNPPPEKQYGPLEEGFKLMKTDLHFIFTPPLWKTFDTYEAEPLPSKDFPIWGNSSRYTPSDEPDFAS